MELTKAEVQHINAALEEFKYWITQYPETVTQRVEDQLAIAMEIMTHEDTVSRHRN